jgi:hypothetical protein
MKEFLTREYTDNFSLPVQQTDEAEYRSAKQNAYTKNNH